MMLSSIDSNNITDDMTKKLFYSAKKEEYEYADYLIIYGCHIKELLDERLQHALNIIKSGKVNKIVLTGGIGALGDFDESEYMLNFLIKNGINKDSIIVENKSTTTEENNINVMKILNLNNVNHQLNIVLVTHQFHLLRLIMHWNKILNNNNIYFYYDYVKNTIASHDNINNNPVYKRLLLDQIEVAKKFINEGIYDDIDIINIYK